MFTHVSSYILYGLAMLHSMAIVYMIFQTIRCLRKRILFGNPVPAMDYPNAPASPEEEIAFNYAMAQYVAANNSYRYMKRNFLTGLFFNIFLHLVLIINYILHSSPPLYIELLWIMTFPLIIYTAQQSTFFGIATRFSLAICIIACSVPVFQAGAYAGKGMYWDILWALPPELLCVGLFSMVDGDYKRKRRSKIVHEINEVAQSTREHDKNQLFFHHVLNEKK